ncbi:MAG: S-layer homology domain-containing protein [Hassallia sp.]
MPNFFVLSLSATSLLLGLMVATGIVPPSNSPVSSSAIAQNPKANFPDTQNHWAQPFIQALAERKIVTGYPDGTYRPNESVDRDEFAAIIRQAFNQKKERNIASGSVYKDVPASYWAASAIEEAYETGFMHGYPGGYFRPRKPVSRVEALVSLAQNLDLKNSAQPNTQSNNNKTPRKQLLLPMAMTTLMLPLIKAKAAIKPAVSSQQPPASVVVSNYYADAEKIPHYAVDDVAAATRAGIVVNHPNTKLLNPTQPANRGAVAAFIYQALVSQGRVEPINSNVKASNYIVGHTEISSK